MAIWADFAHAEYQKGNSPFIDTLSIEEANLLRAMELARIHKRNTDIISIMQGLRTLYLPTGQISTWKRLVEELTPGFVDTATGNPLQGLETEWSLIMEYRIDLAQRARNWPEAIGLLRHQIVNARRQAAPLLSAGVTNWSGSDRTTLRGFAIALHNLADVQRELDDSACISLYEEALSIAERIDDKAGASACAAGLGEVYQEVRGVRDLSQSEHWFQRALELRDINDRPGRGHCLADLGRLAMKQFKAALQANAPRERLWSLLQSARAYCEQALLVLPSHTVSTLAMAHNMLGEIFRTSNSLDLAISHYHKALRFSEEAGDIYKAAGSRFNLALAFAARGRLTDAREYALCALRNYEVCGTGARWEADQTRQTLSEIESEINRNKSV